MAGKIWKPLRSRQIEAISGLMCANDLADDPAYCHQINDRTGWAFDLTPTDPGAEAQGHVIRHEAVVLTESELAEAIALARQWLSESA